MAVLDIIDYASLGVYTGDLLSQEKIDLLKSLAFPKMEVRDAGVKGRGLFTLESISKYFPIGCYAGEKITKKEAISRQDDLNYDSRYIIDFDEIWDLDTNSGGNHTKFVNNSCDPNLEIVFSSEDLLLCAQRDIKAEEELTWNYGYGADEGSIWLPCYCESEDCYGFMIAPGEGEKLSRVLVGLGRKMARYSISELE